MEGIPNSLVALILGVLFVAYGFVSVIMAIVLFKGL